MRLDERRPYVRRRGREVMVLLGALSSLIAVTATPAFAIDPAASASTEKPGLAHAAFSDWYLISHTDVYWAFARPSDMTRSGDERVELWTLEASAKRSGTTRTLKTYDCKNRTWSPLEMLTYDRTGAFLRKSSFLDMARPLSVLPQSIAEAEWLAVCSSKTWSEQEFTPLGPNMAPLTYLENGVWKDEEMTFAGLAKLEAGRWQLISVTDEGASFRSFEGGNLARQFPTGWFRMVSRQPSDLGDFIDMKVEVDCGPAGKARIIAYRSVLGGITIDQEVAKPGERSWADLARLNLALCDRFPADATIMVPEGQTPERYARDVVFTRTQK